MLKNYFKIAFRNLWKNKFFSVINIAGLAAGIGFALFIGAYVWNELKVNNNLKNAGHQYILTSRWKDPNMGYELASLGPLAKRLKETYPGLVKNYYRFDGITSVVSNGEKYFRENIQLGDSTLIAMYGFKQCQGSIEADKDGLYTVAITKSMAIKYFGSADAVGKHLNIQNFSGGNHEFIVTHVLQEPAENSVTHLNDANNNTFFIPINNYPYFGRFEPDNWANNQIVSYVELQENAATQQLEKAIVHLLTLNTPEMVQKNLQVVPVLLKNYYLEKDNAVVKRMLYTLSFIGLFILLMAIVNFINIAISSSGNRTKEIGIRKVMGGLRYQLIAQFLTESLILVTVATGLAMALYPMLQTAFATLVGKTIPGLNVFPVYFIFIPFLLILTVALLAGLYPAFVLSSLKAVDAVKGKLKTVGKQVILRKSLVGFQFCIALIVLIAATVITKQVTHFFGQGLGYNKEYVVSSQVPRDWSKKGVLKMETVRNEFAMLPQVNDVTLSYEIPNGMNGGQPSVYKTGTDSTGAIPMQAMVTDEHYLTTYQIALKDGSFFNGHGLDSGKVIMNEQAIQALGFSNTAEAVGQQIRIPNDPTVFTIKGISKDFHFGSMQGKIPPIIFFNVQFAPTYRYLSFKLKPGNTTAAITSIQKKWSQLLPGSSFEYRFMDDALAALYATEIQLKKAAYAAVILSVVIMLLGVVGLISLSIHKRVKEIGIRKVLGASVSNIILLFVKEFMLIIVPAAAIAIPLANLLMNKWLNNYAYRISITTQPFVMAVILLAAVTFVLICMQTIKAALANPVKSLRSE